MPKLIAVIFILHRKIHEIFSVTEVMNVLTFKFLVIIAFLTSLVSCVRQKATVKKRQPLTSVQLEKAECISTEYGAREVWYPNSTIFLEKIGRSQTLNVYFLFRKALHKFYVSFGQV